MDILAVAVGGFFGAILRYLVDLWIPNVDGFPFATLIINLVGCLLLAYFFTLTEKKYKIDANIKLAIGTGLIGSFTTFSAFSVETIGLLQHHQFTMAVSYILLTIIGGIGLTLFGVILAQLQVDRSVKGEVES